MQRRSVITGAIAAAAGLPMPALVQAASQTTLRFVPLIDLVYLDPVFITPYVTRNHGYMVFDTLYGMDSAFKASPQMVEGHVVEDDGLKWTLTLRLGLFWHDGGKVLARDCIASIQRWAKRDPFGAALIAATDELVTPDDRRIIFRLKHPFPLLPEALGKSSPPFCAMMPERLANTDPFKPVPEIIGSGPFRYKADERVAGVINVYEKFETYNPRPSGVPEGTAGPKIVHYGRVVWNSISDRGTATASLQAAEQDWQELPLPDLLPALRRTRGIMLRTLDPAGLVNMLQINHLHPPFDNPAIRRAVLGALDQRDFVVAVVGDDPAQYRVPLGFFCPDTPMASEAGLDALLGPRDTDRAKAEIKAAGYKGETIVLMVPGDSASLKAIGDVAASLFESLGMPVEYLALDFGTMLTRRNRKAPPGQGGWSAFVTQWAGADWLNPAVNIVLRGAGEAGYVGWASSPRIEQLRGAWLQTPDLAAQKAICIDLQRQAMIDLPFYPLGQYQQQTAHRDTVTGILNGFPVFWNVRPF